MLEDFELSVDQNHAGDAAAVHEVWREVLARDAALISRYGERMRPAYVRGVRELALPARVPRIDELDELDERLAPTGWKTVCVDGYIPTEAYVRRRMGAVPARSQAGGERRVSTGAKGG